MYFSGCGAGSTKNVSDAKCHFGLLLFIVRKMTVHWFTIEVRCTWAVVSSVRDVDSAHSARVNTIIKYGYTKHDKNILQAIFTP